MGGNKRKGGLELVEIEGLRRRRWYPVILLAAHATQLPARGVALFGRRL